MITFEVNDMTCGHCASTISKAVAEVDKDANVQIDLKGHRVVVEPTDATMQQLSDAIKNAGYSPVPVDNVSPVAAATKRSGCCCG
jgi:copper chaperone